VKEQLKRAAQALEADAAISPEPAAADADAAPTQQTDGAAANKAQQRTKKTDDYHARHADWIAQFNELTHDKCTGDDDGMKWTAVHAWQQKH